jgi:TRAP-type C4-dicarboxylate transport system substrate-binding protein
MIDHRDGNHVEVAKYMYPLPLAGAQVLPVIVNRSDWNKLPDDLKAAVRKATEIHAEEQLAMSKKWESEALADMKANGLEWSPDASEADKKAWAKAGSTLREEYAAQGKYSKELIEILNNSGY